MDNFYNLLERTWSTTNSLLCVGLDPDLSRMPEGIGTGADAVLDFNKEIISATSDLVCAYKPQIAFYSGIGAEKELIETIAFIRQKAPRALVILDAKRGDIEHTAEAYATEAFERYKVDAVTLNPYLGGDSLRPFLKRSDKGSIILCRTSNPGASDFQGLEIGGKPLYQIVAEKAHREWAFNKNLLFVVGGTAPEEILKVREVAPNIPFLVPGIGAQGGDLASVVSNGKGVNNPGLIINSSRQIIYADKGRNFANAARMAAEELKNQINYFLRR